MFPIHQLFSPLSWAEFVSTYFEKKHLLIQRGQKDFYRALITLEQVDDVLFSQKLNHPSFRVVDSKTNTYPDPRTYTRSGTSAIDPIAFTGYFHNGGTLAMAGMHHHLRSLRAFCNDLQVFTGHPLQTNLYLTPANSQGFAPHYDTHDVIVLQIHGKKVWKIYASDQQLPDKSMAFEKEGFTPGEVVDEFVLEEGDLLYIPRGVVHDAYTTDDSSLHVTTGVLGYTWSQYIIESLLELTKKEPIFRQFVSSKLTAAPFETQLATLVSKLSEELQTGKGLQRFEEQLLAETPSTEKGHLLQVMAAADLSLASLIETRFDGVLYQSDAEGVTFIVAGKKIVFPAYCAIECSFLYAHKGHVRIEDVPGELDDEGKFVLIRRLVKEGLALIIH
jgi:ribosomal protein L16 Arg81 hydroxylase